MNAVSTALPVFEDCRDLLLEGAMIIDVRTEREFAKGHAEESINVPITALPSYIYSIKKQNKPVIICSKKGIRSEQATVILSESGVEAYNGGCWLDIQEKL